MLTLVSKRLVTKLTGFVFVLAIVAAMGVGVFSAGGAQAAGPREGLLYQGSGGSGSGGIGTYCVSTTRKVGTTYYVNIVCF